MDSGVSLTLKEELSGHSFSFVLVQINHGHFGAGFTQSVCKGPANALAAARHVGHLPVQAQPLEDGQPLHPTEHHVVRYFSLNQEKKPHGIRGIPKTFLTLIFFPLMVTCTSRPSQVTGTRRMMLRPSRRGRMT